MTITCHICKLPVSGPGNQFCSGPHNMSPTTPPPAGTPKDTPRTSRIFDHFPNRGPTVSVRIELARDAMAELERELAAALKERDEARAKQPINTHVRLWDLVRYVRAELHEDDLITDQEYANLCMGTKSDQKLPGSPSPRRLEDYDDLQKELAALRQQLAESHSTFKTFSEQKLTTEMSAEDYEQGDIDFAHDKFIEESRLLLALKPAPET